MSEQIPPKTITEWTEEWMHDTDDKKPIYAYFIVRKACEWQRERDSERIKVMGRSGWDFYTISEAIRKGGE